MTKDKPLVDLENEYEVYMINQVLTDLGISFRIERSSESYMGILFGSGASNLFSALPYARLWGYESDKVQIEELLTEIRNSKPIQDNNKQKMWRIKKS